MDNTALFFVKKALRIIREEGWKSLYEKTKRKIKLYSLGKSLSQIKSFLNQVKLFESGETMPYPIDMAEKWLHDNRNNFNNPFYILLKYLLSLNEQLRDVIPVSCDDYKNYFKKRCFIYNFPFEINFKSVNKREDRIKFINEFDHAYLGKMIRSVFIQLIHFLVQQRGSINLLDFGSGQTCGMYGENGRFLFEEGNVNISGINFFGIDEIHKPSGAIFEKTKYLKCNILSFYSEEKFDLITGHHVLEHCFNWDDIISHVSTLLKQDGYLYLSFPRFGGFYDTAYRLMSPLDHRANFDMGMLKSFSASVGLEMCLSDIYVDPNNRFDWICNLYPELVNKEMAICFYDLCVNIDLKLLLGYHHYGHYVIFRKTI